tara:strand:- start:168 stop:305 length:138 start_codon:yes stop_codon:yes gene_type:complete
MKNLISTFKELDIIDKIGIAFLAFFIVPCLIGVLINVLEKGSNLV